MLKQEILEERDSIKKQLDGSEKRIDRTLELSERTFNFCLYARYHFNNGDLQKKREIFSNLGSNLILKDKKLSIEAFRPYIMIEKELTDQKTLYAGIEPENNGSIKGKEATSIASIPSWLRTLNEIRTFFSENPNAEF